ncbi:tRNA (adenine(22)-N(1))-methyltransferase [Virgibacillus sp. W0181]|uniref:tRNA (adenine(22)-N(1))-methyltransferase n=1 Tax=Virgibacillus sp. W0181 TaxID=3391581 RepID=UPI003F48239B
MRSLHLSKRLETIASYIDRGSFLADIGSDHAYLPCFICLHDDRAKAIAGEVNTGPYSRAKTTVKDLNLQNKVEVRLGDGLAVLSPEEQVTTITVSGMGGSLIKDILQNGRQNIPFVKRMIIQPNTGAIDVRKWFTENKFTITNEDIIEENGHIYEIIIADKLSETGQNLSPRQLLFGPKLLDRKSDQFLTKWELERNKLERVTKQMKKANELNTEKLKQYELELEWIKEVLTVDE